MMRQYHQVKQAHPDKLVFFRLGDFYEMFYEDAVLGSRLLEITLTSRHNDRRGEPIPMCGIPCHAVNTYLQRLIKRGHKVAICDQVEAPQPGKKIVRREVTRVVTPGTVVEEGLLESGENNFIASLLDREERVGAAFLDVSTGEFMLTEFSGSRAWTRVLEELAHFRPRELVVPERAELEVRRRIPEPERADLILTTYADWTFNTDFSQRTLLEHFRVATLEGFGINAQKAALGAAGGLLHYVKETQRSRLSHLTSIRYSEPSRYLKMDETTVANLELVRGLDGNKAWTLLSTLDQTKTSMGARLLRSWLLRPLLQIEKIEGRLEAVQELTRSVVVRGRLGHILSSVYDLERLLSRVTLQTANPKDLLALRDSFRQLPALNHALKPFDSPLLQRDIDPVEDLEQLLGRAIDDDAPVQLHDGGIIKSGFDPSLDELRAAATSGKKFIAGLERQERERTGIGSLKVKYNKVFGYFIEVTKARLGSVPEDYRRKQTLVGAERFVTTELNQYEEKVLGAEERIQQLEKELFTQVRGEVAAQAHRIQQAAQKIARIDVLASLAEVTQARRYVRPQMENSSELVIRGGRHPVLESQAQEPFVPNDLHCDTGDRQLLILTGPNMGGKSTYLRQNALIVVLAQMGSFVPCEEARIGLVDSIFTRVGANDNLAKGRSTFMVEMIETAHILNSATPRSLILLDEVGRGTATFDGLSLAWSVAEYLTTEAPRRARTLFATHYQELTQLARLYPGVKNYRVTVRENAGEILFFHRVLEGVASKSYGIEVARLAGLPQPVLERARQILARLEKKEVDLTGRARLQATRQVTRELQPTLF